MQKKLQNKSSVSKEMATKEASIRMFLKRQSFLRQQVAHGERALPLLKKQLRNIRVGLPKWLDELRVLELSLSTHRTGLFKQAKMVNLETKRDKLLAKLRQLDV